MALRVIRKYLDNIEVYKDDTSNNSSDYFVLEEVPEVFRLGTNIIRSKPNLDNLKVNTPVEIEAFDANGEGVPFSVRPISGTDNKIELELIVNPDTPIESISIVFVGILRDDLVPVGFQDRFNVRWQKTLIVDRKGVKIFGSPSGSLITGSFFIGRKPGTGMEMTGKNSSLIKSTDYAGFNTATASLTPSGFMMFSGSVLPGTSDDYKGVGLELVAGPQQYFKFRSSPGSLEIKTDQIIASGSKVEINTPNFFLGSATAPAMISGSNGILQISSSRFVVDAAGGLSASSALFQNTCRADMFIYRETKINPGATGGDNHILNTYSNGSRNYIVLEMTGSPDYGGPDTGHFIRVQGLKGTYGLDAEYPIGAINIAGYDDNKFVTFIMIENAMGSGNTLYFAQNKPVPGTSNIEILKSDTDDWTEKSWNAATGSTEGAYSGLLALNHGARLLLFKSEFDWRIQSTSEYNHIAPYFASGSHHKNPVFLTDITSAGGLQTDGSGKILATSDRNLKTNIQALSGSLDKLMSLRPVSFEYKKSSGIDLPGINYGLIAQEVSQSLLTELHHHVKKPFKDDYWNVNYLQIITLLLDSIQELNQRIQKLENE